MILVQKWFSQRVLITALCFSKTLLECLVKTPRRASEREKREKNSRNARTFSNKKAFQQLPYEYIKY